jgi:hypothetical protein
LQVRVINPHDSTTLTLLRDKRIDHTLHVCQQVRHRLAQQTDQCPKGGSCTVSNGHFGIDDIYGRNPDMNPSPVHLCRDG